MTTEPVIDYEKIKVLIIEDEKHTRSIIRSQVHGLGCREIFEAGDGKEGLLELARVRPHFVLCDIHMPVMDGLQFLRALRALKIGAVRNTPVIFLTADSQRDTVVFAKEQGVTGYLVKPCSAAQIQAHIVALAEKMTFE